MHPLVAVADCRYQASVDRHISDSPDKPPEATPGPVDFAHDEDGANSALSFRDFRLFLAMRLPSNLASQMQSVAIGWQIYDITHRPLDLGFVGLAQFLPVFGLALVSGHVADRFDRRIVLALCFGIQ